MVRDLGFEPKTYRVSDGCSNQTELIPHGGTDGFCPRVLKLQYIKNLILTLQVLPYIYMGQGDDSIPASLCSPTFREGFYINNSSQ